MRSFHYRAAVLCAALPASVASAALYSENFDVDATANWTVKAAHAGASAANLFFDYSTVGIPSAPNSTGGSTRGVKLISNYFGAVPAAVFTGISVSPTGQSFSGDYEVTADVWMNFNGPAPAGGSGSTQAGGVGIMTAGATAQWAGGTQDSVHFSTTLDGNSATDYRAYSPGPGATSYVEASGVYAAGNVAGVRNGSHSYYDDFGNITAPAAQTLLYPQQTGNTSLGTQAFSWHAWKVRKDGAIVRWYIDNLLLATVDTSALTLGGSNILLNHYDTNGARSTDANSPALLFTLFDNVTVTQVPEPGSLGLLLGAGVLALRRRK